MHARSLALGLGIGGAVGRGGRGGRILAVGLLAALDGLVGRKRNVQVLEVVNVGVLVGNQNLHQVGAAVLHVLNLLPLVVIPGESETKEKKK